MSDDPLESALRALRHRDRTVREVEELLDERGFSSDERDDVIERLRRTGLLDDVRFAQAHALSLAERGAGDALIRHRLARAGVARELVDEALGQVEPEALRARRIVARRGASPKTARYLAGKGFADDVVGIVVAEVPHGELR